MIMTEDREKPILLPHHEQQALCTTRLPYRQGRKLTAVKTYSINNESRHLLVFGVPSLNLRQETKALFSRFGKLQFNITTYPSEKFTETYHAAFENISSARLAKKMLDTKNYYGGNLHVCYAPELENINDTREKLVLRRNSVVARLKNLQKPTLNENSISKEDTVENIDQNNDDKKLYMGNENNLKLGKRKTTDYKSVKHCKLKKLRNFDRKTCVVVTDTKKDVSVTEILPKTANTEETVPVTEILPETVCDIVDFTSADTEILTNINETLNYDNFGKELIKQVPYKPVNKIKFNLNKNT